MSRFFSKKLPRLALGAVVVLVGFQGQIGTAKVLQTPGDVEASTWRVALRGAPDGGQLFEAVADDLRVTKSMTPAGDIHVTLTDGADTMTLDINSRGTTVTSQGRSARLTIEGANEDSFNAMKTLVQGSAVAQKFHARMSGDVGDRRTLHAGLAITHALLRSLEGDESAVRDLRGQLLVQHEARMQPVRFRQGGCYRTYEIALVDALYDFEACVGGMSTWERINYGVHRCTFRYLIWAEGLWFQFVRCSAFPL